MFGVMNCNITDVIIVFSKVVTLNTFIFLYLSSNLCRVNRVKFLITNNVIGEQCDFFDSVMILLFLLGILFSTYEGIKLNNSFRLDDGFFLKVS